VLAEDDHYSNLSSPQSLSSRNLTTLSVLLDTPVRKVFVFPEFFGEMKMGDGDHLPAMKNLCYVTREGGGTFSILTSDQYTLVDCLGCLYNVY
jgi:hypothetical protein